MRSLLAVIGRKAPLVLVGGVVLGLVLPGLGNVIGWSIPLLVIMLLAVAMARVDFAQVLTHLRRPLRLGFVLLILMAGFPLAAHALAGWFGLSPILHLAVVLVACGPPLASSPSMAVLLKLDDALVLNVMVVGTLIVPLSAPTLAVSVLDIPVDLEVGPLLLRLALTIGLALAAAIVIRRVMGRDRIEKQGDVLDGISALMMVIFAVVVMNGIGLTGMQDPWQVLYVLAVVFLANWGLHALTGAGLIVFRAVRKNDEALLSPQSGAIALIAGNRNMALFLAALPADTAEALFLFIALYQLPIYLTPIMAAPIYRRLLR